METRSRSRRLVAAGGVVAVSATTASFAVLPAQAVDHDQRPGFRVVRLVADTPGRARTTDRGLVNAWGLAASRTSPLWVADNGTSTSTLYQGATGRTGVQKMPLDVRIPGGGDPTGVLFNPTRSFRLSTGGKTGPALFVFAGENGDLSAWNKSGDPSRAVLVAHTRNAVYKGLTRVSTRGRQLLLAANFHSDRIDVFNGRFARVHLRHAFSSRGIPRGYAPFGVAALRGRVYVTYAKQDATGHDDVAGRGNGFVKVFDQRGRSLGSLVRHGVLNSPWGLAIAPRGFGAFAGKLLVGNFGDGRIHVVDQRARRVVATLRDGSNRPIRIDGLWGLLPGNGTAGKRSDVWFSAGPGGEAHGLLGILRHR